MVGRSPEFESRPGSEGSEDLYCTRGNGVGYLTTALILMNGAQQEWGTVRNGCARRWTTPNNITL